MDVVIGLVTVSLALVALGLVFFFARLKGGDFDHGERLSLLPLREDRPRAEAAGAAAAPVMPAAPHAAAAGTAGSDSAGQPPADLKEGGVANGRG
jgi:cbb3-type cytochrome oxidase maturation protein